MEREKRKGKVRGWRMRRKGGVGRERGRRGGKGKVESKKGKRIKVSEKKKGCLIE